MYTYNRTDDARINMEIIRNLWSKNELLKDVVIVHSYNGEREWWPEKYLEDELLRMDNLGHFAGAEMLLNEGVKLFSEKYSDIDYVITLAPDTWLIKPEYIEKIITIMQKEKKYHSTCPWGTEKKDNMWKIGMALDFNIFDLGWVTKHNLFPINFSEFVKKYSEIFFYQDEIIYLERVFALRFKQAILESCDIPSENLLKKVAKSYVYRMKDREPVHDERKLFWINKGRKMYWENIGLITYHDPKPKRDILKKLNLQVGKYSEYLISSTDLGYYNKGVKKTSYLKDDKKINYGD
ncbi:hypothetical protein KKH36_01665 [Patescibacteria group bacterium]|nr:hypothetical protein [Patescibacteria group bacterium]